MKIRYAKQSGSKSPKPNGNRPKIGTQIVKRDAGNSATPTKKK